MLGVTPRLQPFSNFPPECPNQQTGQLGVRIAGAQVGMGEGPDRGCKGSDIRNSRNNHVILVVVISKYTAAVPLPAECGGQCAAYTS